MTSLMTNDQRGRALAQCRVTQAGREAASTQYYRATTIFAGSKRALFEEDLSPSCGCFGTRPHQRYKLLVDAGLVIVGVV
mmetsp:Transcript_22917/g.40250  ORF Transcript_22917/g.40250 Transcript_22917/m.40250 type:complete len:80 (+) Transcript_22917:69-308(+)